MLAPVRPPPSFATGESGQRLRGPQICALLSPYLPAADATNRSESRPGCGSDPQPLVAEEPRRKPFVQGYLRSTFGESGGNFSEIRLADCYSGGRVSGPSQG